MVGLAGALQAVAEGPVVAISVREVPGERAAKTQWSKQTLAAQQSRRLAWEVCTLAGAE